MYATNLDCRNPLFETEGIPEEYKKRWGIETGYRDAERSRPKTTGQNAVIRIFLFFMALVMYNLWVIPAARSGRCNGGRRDVAVIPLLIMFELMEKFSADVVPGRGIWPEQPSAG